MATNRFERMQSRVLAVSLGAMLSFGFAQAAAAADELPREAVLPLALASKAAAAALDKCTKDGYRVSVSVVDRAGIPRALVRGDGAAPHAVDSSTKKAYTAASLRRPTSELTKMIAENPGAQGLRDINDKVIFLGGGLPIEMGGEIVGGIGVGGAPGGHLDEACAQAGLDSIGAAPKVPAAK